MFEKFLEMRPETIVIVSAPCRAGNSRRNFDF